MTTLQERTYIRRSTLVSIWAIWSLSLRRSFLSFSRTSSEVGSSPELDAKDLTIGCVVTARQTPEQIIGFCEPRDEHGFVGKLVL